MAGILGDSAVTGLSILVGPVPARVESKGFFATPCGGSRRFEASDRGVSGPFRRRAVTARQISAMLDQGRVAGAKATLKHVIDPAYHAIAQGGRRCRTFSVAKSSSRAAMRA
jgi:hypothetical protein